MKTYKEYYQIGLSHHLDWKSKQDEEWWKNKNDFGYLEVKGDFIETVKFLSIDEKNDASLFINTTNVKNSEWNILFSMLGQALVDWCVENVSWKNLWSVHFQIKRSIDENGMNFYVPTISVENFKLEKTGKYKWQKSEKETSERKLKKFDECNDFLCKLVVEFIESHGVDIPNDWNDFSFGLDSLSESCKWGEWVCASDGYMNLGNYNVEEGEYDQFVECM